MVVPVELRKGRNDPRSPYYEPSKHEQRMMQEEKQKEHAQAERIENLMRKANCRECGAKNDRVSEYCVECEP